jgi:RNA polymerase sigma-70 factor (ECF subfamily)
MTTPPNEITDGTLVLRARRGDAPAFEALVRRHYGTAYAVAMGQVGNGMDAEDVCQDAFIRALEKLDNCRDPDKFRAWLMQIVRNGAHNFRDYRRVRDASDLDTVAAAAPDNSVRDLEQQELGGALSSALEQLNDVPRQVVLLHDLEGMRHKEIAQTLDISEGMSRQHLFQARKLLRVALGHQALQEHFDDG